MRYDVQCEVDGQEHHGTYCVEEGMVTVSSATGSKTARAGVRPDVLAKVILAELVRSGW